MKHMKLWGRVGPAVPFFLLVGMFLFLPLFHMVVKSLMIQGGNGFTFQNYLDVGGKEIYRTAIKNSLYLSVLSSLAGLFISFCLCLALGKIGKREQKTMTAVLNMVSNFSGLPMSIAFMILMGTSGILTTIAMKGGIPFLKDFRLYTAQGLLLLYIYFQIPLGTLLLLPAFQGVRSAWKEAAELMGTSASGFWVHIGIPILLPSLFDTCAMLFANALTAYATPFMLVSTNFPLLSIKTASMFTGEMRVQQELGSAFSVTMLLIMLAVIGLCSLAKRVCCKGGTI